jgi:hypothetical protein
MGSECAKSHRLLLICHYYLWSGVQCEGHWWCCDIRTASWSENVGGRNCSERSQSRWNYNIEIKNCMCFAPCIVIQLYNTNQRNVQFSKLILNFCCLLHVSNIVGSSSGRQLYVHYGLLYIHRYEQSGGWEGVFSLDTPPYPPTMSETYKRQHKLNINMQVQISFPRDATLVSLYFISYRITLHVSGALCAHHQEF